jgi:hypothetical protein
VPLLLSLEHGSISSPSGPFIFPNPCKVGGLSLSDGRRGPPLWGFGVLTIECAYCGRAATKHRLSARFCSRRCKERMHDRRRRPRQVRPACATCGITLPKGRHRFCSATCNPKAWAGRQHFTCVQCQNPLPKGARKFCGPQCRLLRMREKQSQRPQRHCRECGIKIFGLRLCAVHLRQRRNRQRADRRAERSAAKNLLRELQILPKLPKPGSRKQKRRLDPRREWRREETNARIVEAKRLWTTWSALFNPLPYRQRRSLCIYISEILSLRGQRVPWRTVHRWRLNKWKPRKEPQAFYRLPRRKRNPIERRREYLRSIASDGGEKNRERKRANEALGAAALKAVQQLNRRKNDDTHGSWNHRSEKAILGER